VNRERQEIVEAFFGGVVVPREALRTVYALARDAGAFDERQLTALAVVRRILDVDHVPSSDAQAIPERELPIAGTG
jgi:hypothetical protein